jgi:hypothetical protein
MKEAAAADDDDDYDAQNLHNFPSLLGGWVSGWLCVVWVFGVFLSLTSLK